MATVNFLYRSTKDKAPLTLRLLFRYQEKDYVIASRTKYIVEKEYWNKKHFKNTKDAEIKNKQIEVNSDLQKLENHVLNTFNDESNLKLITKEWLSDCLSEYYNPQGKENIKSELVTDNIQYVIDTAHTRENGKKGIGLGECRINGYKRLKQLFIEFQQKKNYKVKDLNQNMFDSFRTWLLNDKNYSPTYAYKKCVDLKSVCKDARKNGVEVSYDLTDIKTKQVSAYDDDMDVIILTPDELETIEKTELPTKALENARKWLLLACYTGQRGNDLTTRIHEKNFEHYGNDLIIRITQQKGNKTVIIPVLPKVREIYENGMPYIIAIQNLNKYFKEIGKLAGLNELTMGRKQEKGKRGVKRLRPKYEYISTHIGRRSFASNHYGKIPTPIIMAVTGHSKESTFLTYINQTDNSHVDTFLDFYKKNEKNEKKANLKVLKASNQ